MNAAEREALFSGVKEAILNPSSGRWKLVAVRDFLRSVEPDGAAVEAYVMELLEQLKAVLTGLEPGGQDPDVPVDVAVRLAAVAQRSEQLSGDHTLREVLAALRRVAAVGYAVLGDFQTCWSTLVPDGSPVPSPMRGPGTPEPAAVLAQAAATLDGPSRAELAATARSVAELTKERVGTVAVPVVEHGFGTASGHLVVGGMRSLSVDIFGESVADDEIRPEVVLGSRGPAMEAAFAGALAGGRTLLERLTPAARSIHFRGRIRFDARGVPHDGESAGCAIALLFLSSAQQFMGLRQRYVPAAGAAVTGALAPDGSVIPVDGDSLEIKVQAAFFSASQALAVPESQLGRARDVIDSLGRRYPARRLDVVGVRTLRDVLSDRRLVNHVSTPRSMHAARWLWERRFTAAGMTLTAVLAIVTAWLALGPIDRSPVGFRIEGTELRLVNRTGRGIRSIQSTSKTTSNPERARDRTAFGDVDGDGLNEFCWSEEADGRFYDDNLVQCIRSGEAEAFFVARMRFDDVYPDDPQIVTNRYSANRLHLVDVDRDGGDELIILAGHRTYYPWLVLVYDPVTGAEVGRYVHTGALYASTLFDLDSDGVPELLAGGINNALQASILLVLDPERLSGSSPTDSSRMPARYDPGHELAYLVFPRGPVARLPSVEGDRRVSTIDVQPENGQVNVVLMEGRTRLEDGSLSEQAKMVYHLGFDLSAKVAASHSAYDRVEQYLVSKGTLPAAMTTDDRVALARAVRYWDGSSWHDSTWTRLAPTASPTP